MVKCWVGKFVIRELQMHSNGLAMHRFNGV